MDILGRIELSGFDDVVLDAESSLPVVVEVVTASSDSTKDDDVVRKLILFGSKALGCIVKLFAFSALAFEDLISS